MMMMIHHDDFDVGECGEYNNVDDHDFIRYRYNDYNDEDKLFIRFGSSMGRRLLKRSPDTK